MFSTLWQIDDAIESKTLNDFELWSVKISELPESYPCHNCSALSFDANMRIIALLQKWELVWTFCEHKNEDDDARTFPIRVLPHIENSQFPAFSCPVDELLRQTLPRNSLQWLSGCPCD